MMTLQEYEDRCNQETWFDLESRPHGKITTVEQFEYVLFYCSISCIGGTTDSNQVENIDYEEAKDKYLKLGSHFGGASFYFYMSDEPEAINPTYEYGKMVSCDGYYEEFTYGDYGEVENTNKNDK